MDRIFLPTSQLNFDIVSITKIQAASRETLSEQTFLFNMIDNDCHLINIFALYNIYGAINTNLLLEFGENDIIILSEIRQYSREFYLNFAASRRVIVATSRLYVQTAYCEAHHGRMHVTKRWNRRHSAPTATVQHHCTHVRSRKANT